MSRFTKDEVVSRFTKDEVGRPADEIVVERARALCFSRNQDPNKFEFIHAATLEVLRSDKALGESYKRLDEEVE